MHRTTILVADDHSIVKEGLVSLLKEHDFDLVGAVTDGVALVEEARRLRPDVIISDISMPRLSGLEALERIMAEHLPCKIIMLTSSINPQDFNRSKKYVNVKLYLNKPLTHESIMGLSL